MSDMVKHFEQMAKDIEILRGDVIKMVEAKKQEHEKSLKNAKEEKTIEEISHDKSKKASLNFLQQGTHLYKSKEEIKQAKANPVLDYVNKGLSTILRK